MRNQHGVDFDEVVKNAEAQGIDLSEISLLYKGLTEMELQALRRLQLVVAKTDACVIGRFSKEGIALFARKVTGVYSLRA